MSNIVEDAQRRVAYWRYIAANAAEIGIAVPTLDMPGVADIVEGLLSEIARLRLATCRLADQDATLSVQGGKVIVEMDVTPEMLRQLSPRGVVVTEAQRGAVEDAMEFAEGYSFPILAGQLSSLLAAIDAAKGGGA